MAVFSSFGQVQIGDGALIDKGLPFEPSRSYSYTQSIYLSSEILATGSITSLQWYYAGEYDLSGSQEIKIYLGHTTKALFSSTSNWEPIANLTQVYSGGAYVLGPGWINFQFQTPFEYNGTDNLVIAVTETSPEADYSEDDFYTYAIPDNRSLTYSSFSNLPNLQNPANGTLRKFAPIIILEGINQACPKPTSLVASEPTTTGITLDWDSSGGNPSGGSQYYISATNVAPIPTTEPTGSVASGQYQAIITGELLPATKYYVWVRDVCDGGPGTWSNASSFTTACEPADLINQNFNSTTIGTLPVCWSSIVHSSEGTTTSSVGVTNEDGYNGGRSVQFYRNGDANSELTLVLPPLSNLGAGTHRLRFFAKNFIMTPTGSFKIGHLDANDVNSIFEEIDQITTTNTFKEFIIDFSQVTTDNLLIGIRLSSDDQNYLGYIDNIVWELAPLCPDVAQISIPSITTTTANVAWVSEDLDEWEVVYGTSATANPDTLTPVINASENPTALIEGLSPETNYHVWVRSKCESGTGFWVGPVAFRTPCSPVNTIYENFDSVTGTNLPTCWARILRGETLSPYASIKTVMDGANSAPRAMELYSGFSGPAPTDDIILVSPNLGNLSAGTHRLKFFASGNDAILEIGTLSGNTSGAEFTTFHSIPISSSSMNLHLVDFATYTDSNTFIGFRLNTDSWDKRIILDDIVWEISPSCPDITDITFSGTTSFSTLVTWPESGATKWQIVYGAPSDMDPETLTPSEVLISSEFEMTDLNSNTTYKVWVRSVCDEADGNGTWSYPIFITTSCAPVATFSENFENANVPDLPSCWTSILNSDPGSAGGVGLITWQPYAGAIGVELYTNSSLLSTAPILVSPALSNLGAGTNWLRFYANHSDTANLEIGTLNTQDDTPIFVPFEFIELTSNYEEYIVDFTSYSGTDINIGFRIHSTDAFKSVGLDNIVWESAPSCANVTNITVSEISTSSADVTWTAGSDENGWQYVYAEDTVIDPANLTPSNILDNESAQLTGLSNGTLYNVWVRSVCNETSFGSWVGPITFLTQCLAANVPYTEDFESVLVPNLPSCSSIFNDADDVNWKTVNSPGSGFTSKTLSYGPNENNGNAWFFTRGINLTAGENYVISYKYGNNSAGLHESLRVKYGTEESIGGMTLEIADHNDVTGATPQTSSVPFTVSTTGVYYFGFNAYSPSNQWQLFVDDIKVETNLSKGDFDNANFTFYPNPVKNVLNLSYNQNISSVAVYNLLGQKVIESKIKANSTQVNMSDLASGNYIVKVTSENQTKTFKIIKE